MPHPAWVREQAPPHWTSPLRRSGALCPIRICDDGQPGVEQVEFKTDLEPFLPVPGKNPEHVRSELRAASRQFQGNQPISYFIIKLINPLYDPSSSHLVPTASY